VLAAVALLALSTGAAVASPPKSKPAAVAPVAPPPPPPAEPLPPPKIYLFRGAMGPIFSTGMDRLSEKLTKAGFSADVYEFTICRWIGDRAITSYKESPAPIVLIGHSMGGLCSIVISEMAAKENIPISLVIAIDPAHATGDVPLNVERFINIFLSDSVLGGGDVVAVPGFRGHYASYDLKENARVSHINIEKSDDIHRQIVEMVTQLPRIPPQTQADAVPLRYLVPGDTLYAARRFRAKVIEATQASHDALLEQPVDGLSTADRLRVAAHVCTIAGAASLAEHCEARLAADAGRDASSSPALPAMLQFAAALTTDPRRGDRAALEPLRRAGLADPAIVALAQLVAFVSYQLRVVAGLRAMRASRDEAAS